MENTQVILGLLVVILVGLITVLVFRGKRSQVISDYAIDEIRRILWEKGETLINFRTMSIWEAFKQFGLAVIPNAAYRDNYFVEVKATDENGKEETYLTRIVLAFEKDVIETEWKKA